MEIENNTATEATSSASIEKIRSAYIEYLLTHGKRPASVYKFCLDLGIREDEFYSIVGSFEGLEKLIWRGFADSVVSRLQVDDAFQSFSTREKMLTFYYALLESLKQNRSFVLFQLERTNKMDFVPEYIKGFRASFESFAETILNQGRSNGEIAKRPLLDKRYPRLFWMHLGFILLFWKSDDSADFEKTDVAVEKSVNLAFDLIGKGAVDSAVDFAKFLYQTKSR